MGKRIEIDGKFYRMRRGKMVEIPAEWLNKVTSPATIRQRPSKLHRKLRRKENGVFRCFGYKDKRDLLRSDPKEVFE